MHSLDLARIYNAYNKFWGLLSYMVTCIVIIHEMKHDTFTSRNLSIRCRRE